MAIVITGAQQRATWDLTAGSTPKAVGHITGGGDMTEDPRSVESGIANQGSFFAGAVAPRARLQGRATSDTKALLLHALRGAGSLTELKVIIGTTAVNFAIANALINSMKLSGQAGQPLEFDLDFLGLSDVETAAGISPVALGSELLPWSGSTITVGGAAYETESWEAGIENGCEHHWDLDSKSAGLKRLPSVISTGIEAVSLSLSTRKQIAWTLAADAPVVNIAAVILYTDGVNSLTLTFANLSFAGNRGLPLQAGSGKSLWQYNLIGKPGSLVII